jgi:hypothetical protein
VIKGSCRIAMSLMAWVKVHSIDQDQEQWIALSNTPALAITSSSRSLVVQISVHRVRCQVPQASFFKQVMAQLR